jgi:hypothetical protein
VLCVHLRFKSFPRASRRPVRGSKKVKRKCTQSTAKSANGRASRFFTGYVEQASDDNSAGNAGNLMPVRKIYAIPLTSRRTSWTTMSM